MNSYDKFYNSFKQNFGDGEEIGDDFLKVFEKIARQLDRLEVLDCIIDVGKKKRIVDFNVYLPDDLFISVCRYLDSTGQIYELEGGGEVVVDDETVFYSVDRHHITLSIGIMHLDEFTEKMLEIQREIGEINKKSRESA